MKKKMMTISTPKIQVRIIYNGDNLLEEIVISVNNKLSLNIISQFNKIKADLLVMKIQNSLIDVQIIKLLIWEG